MDIPIASLLPLLKKTLIRTFNRDQASKWQRAGRFAVITYLDLGAWWRFKKITRPLDSACSIEMTQHIRNHAVIINRLLMADAGYVCSCLDKCILILYRGNRDFPLFKMLQSLRFENICSPHSKNFLLHFIKSHFSFLPNRSDILCVCITNKLNRIIMSQCDHNPHKTSHRRQKNVFNTTFMCIGCRRLSI